MKTELFEQLVASVRVGGAILKGQRKASRAFEVTGPSVKQIRDGYGLSQSEFATLLGISLRTLQNWEQGRRAPEGPAKVLLQVAARHPGAVWDVVKPVKAKKPAGARPAPRA